MDPSKVAFLVLLNPMMISMYDDLRTVTDSQHYMSR